MPSQALNSYAPDIMLWYFDRQFKYSRRWSKKFLKGCGEGEVEIKFFETFMLIHVINAYAQKHAIWLLGFTTSFRFVLLFLKIYNLFSRFSENIHHWLLRINIFDNIHHPIFQFYELYCAAMTFFINNFKHINSEKDTY